MALLKGQRGKTLISVIIAVAVLAVGMPLVSAFEAHTVNVHVTVKGRPRETLVKTMRLATNEGEIDEIQEFLDLALARDPPIPNFPPGNPNPWLFDTEVDPPVSDNVVPKDTFILWVVRIDVSNTEDLGNPCWTDVVVKDNFSAELGGIPLGTDVVDLFVKSHSRGKSKKEIFETQYRITWYVTWDEVWEDNSGLLCPGESAYLELYLWTKLNPALHQEYTSTGTYTMNSGPNVKWFNLEGQQFSFDGEPLYITAY